MYNYWAKIKLGQFEYPLFKHLLFVCGGPLKIVPQSFSNINYIIIKIYILYYILENYQLTRIYSPYVETVNTQK